MPLACRGASKPDSHHTKKPYRPRRERASTSSCLTLFRLDCRCSKSSALGGWAIGVFSDLFRLNSSLMRAATCSEISLIRIQLTMASLSSAVALARTFPLDAPPHCDHYSY